MTITDPRHPLYGRTFPLLEVRQTHRQPAQCVIELDPALHRVIPLAVTDRAEEPRLSAPLPLNLLAVRQLLAVFQQLTHSQTEVSAHVTHNPATANSSDPPASQPDHPPRTGAGLDPIDRPATAGRAPGAGAGLSGSPQLGATHHAGGQP